MKAWKQPVLVATLLATSIQFAALSAHAEALACEAAYRLEAVQQAVPAAPKPTTNADPSVRRILTEEEVGNRKSPLAPKPLLIRVFSNLYRWYFKKDTRDLTEKKFNFLNDYEYIKEKRNIEKVGIVRSFFSKEFDTRVYYTATGAPNAKGEIPVVDPKSKGLFIYFHGSGTNKASGVNFAYKMNRMATMGFSTIAIDLPYHSEGSRSAKMADPVHFYAMIQKLIREYNTEHLPVYLAGHSFGPDLAAEYFKRYPNDPDLAGVLMISPGGFNKVLEDWFMNKTAHMTALWGDIVSNDDGAAWAGLLSSQHKWRYPGTKENPDPTVVNPRVHVKVITGEYEEYVPGELDHRGLPTKTPRTYDMTKAIHEVLKGAEVIIEPGVGHYIFEHKDKDGYDVIIRSMLDIAGESMAREKELKAESNFGPMADHIEIVRKYAREPFFKAWIDSMPGGKEKIISLMEAGDTVSARKMITDYNRFVLANRDRALIQNIVNTQVWNPIFYNQNRAEIDAIDMSKPKVTVSDALINKYYAMLEQVTEAARNKNAIATGEVFAIPEKQGIPQHILDRMEQDRLNGRDPKDKKRDKKQQQQQQLPAAG